ncbi:hypothetical protein JCM10213_008677 [Rhodosporidiobolus nylandii]
MLLSLPIELVEHIATLRACCLVSKALRTVAHPILLEAVRLKDGGDWPGTRVALAGAPEQLRLFWLSTSSAIFRWPDLAEFLPACGNLQEMRLCYLEDVDLAWLSTLPNFRRLSLASVTLADSVFALPHLTELTLTIALAYFGRGPPYGPSLMCFATSSGEEADDLVEDLLSTAYAVRLYYAKDEYEDGLLPPQAVIDILCILESLLEHPPRSSLRLRLLYLLTLPTPPSELGAAQELVLSRVLASCKRRGIEVDFKDTDETSGAALVSPKHKAWGLARKAEQAEKERVEQAKAAGASR